MTLIYLIIILGITILIHELGHFIFAKKVGIYVYEFALGMGPRIFSKKRKNDETIYSIRLIPIGGFVQLAGESVDVDRDIPANMNLQSKKWGERFITIIAGVMFNFILAIVLLFIIGLFYGVPNNKPLVHDVYKNYPAYLSGIQKGDIILKVNDVKVSNWDDILVRLELSDKTKPITLEVKHPNDTTDVYNIELKKEIVNDQETYRLGILISDEKSYGVINAIRYAGQKIVSLFKIMFIVISNLITGRLGLDKVSGPIGIYKVVGTEAKAGFDSLIYLVAFLSVNIGFINLIPFPAFDGGRLLFLIIEKIKGSPVNSKVENTIHSVGFALLMILMVYITFNDLLKLF
jgi:regulator of sigma E protease